MMNRWLNPRVLAVALSLVVMLQVSKLGEPHATMRRDWIACAAMILLYFAAFLVPLARTLGVRSVVGPAALLLLGWGSIALAMVSESLPVPLWTQRHANWPMIAFCAAGFAAFFLFFAQMARSYALLDEVREARGEFR